MVSSTMFSASATQPMAFPTPTTINGTQLVPAFNGTLVNDQDCTASTCSLEFANLRYIPEISGNLAYLIIFAIFLVPHLVLGPLYRTWGFSVGVLCGLILEVIGYVGRIGLHNDVFDFNSFIIYLVCLTIAPAFISASIYLCLSRIIVTYSERISRFAPKTYTLVFVCCDLISLILQAAGGAIAATSKRGSTGTQTGVNIMIAGLAFQVASLTLFIALGIDFIFAARRARQSDLNSAFATLRARKLFHLFPYALAIATLTIFIRCCFRVAELKDGFGGSLANNQTLFMIFEGPMIMIAVLSLTLFHAGVAFGGKEGWRAANWTWKKQTGVTNRQSEDYQEIILAERKLDPASGAETPAE